MAGMENIEVHSKSYLVRWVNVAAGHSISWSIQPHKKSLNFGIFKHPGASAATPDTPAAALEVPTRGRGLSTSRNEKTFVLEKLTAIGLRQVHWQGKCEADQVSMGKYDVPAGEGGMYGLVFDNTFSKTVSKTATFVLMTYPTNAPPTSGHHMHYAQALAGQSTTSLSKYSPSLQPAESAESLPQTLADRPQSASYRPHRASVSNHSFLTGVLQKKRRKKNQGYARRFFSLDFTSSTLSYYRNDHSSALRGAIPLSLAAIGANEQTREISVDSGAEIWQLRANNAKDFIMWKDALDHASRTAGATASPTLQITESPYQNMAHPANPAEDNEWARVEALVGRVSGTRDAVRMLAQQTDPRHSAPPAPATNTVPTDALSPAPSEVEATDYFPENGAPEKKAFWKRKASTSGPQSPAGLFKRNPAAQPGGTSPGAIPPVPPLPANGGASTPKRGDRQSIASQLQEGGVHDNCMAVLRDLDSVVKEFSDLIAESKQRRAIVPLSAVPSRHSIDSQESTDEFFDAHDGGGSKSQLLTIRRDSQDNEFQPEQEQDDVSDGESESSSDHGNVGVDRARMSRDVTPSLFPTKPKSLSPLPLSPVKRRTTIKAPTTLPPSLIAFFRKNVGKDLSTIAMPVSSNEPTSALQRIAEQLEYSELLDAAATAAPENGERLVYMAAFAISYFSNTRVKDRAIRKPFNPMLGETFELVREDKGFRFIAEKVVHRPVRMACQAEAQQWTFIQSPTPVQKFWGKSAELNTEGRVRVFLHASGEHYSWTIATSYLRNVIAGEKYLEPSGTMSIVSETTGAKAVCTFKAGGMFAGRSEEVSVEVFDASGSVLPIGATGKWTTELQMTSNGQPVGTTIWKVGPLVDKAEKHYGLTTFAAALNEITPIENNHMPVTDSRLRPDQRALEDGDLDKAEGLKAQLEEGQRARRKVMEERGEEWKPRWFSKVGAEEAGGLGDEEVWRLRGGREGYWECRERGEWEGVTEIFQT